VALALGCCLVAWCGAVFLLGGIELGRGHPAASATPQALAPLPEPMQRPPTAGERETAQAVAGADLPTRDLLELAHRLQGLPEPIQAARSGPPPGYELGDRATFRLQNQETNTFFTATATLRCETAHTTWWIEDGYVVPAEDLQRSAWNFENQTYPTNHRYFGSEWNPGIDGDPHIYIFLGKVPGVGGYFSGPDEYPVEVRPDSNEHEMFYVNLDNASVGDSYFDGVLAHEFQHMIHWAMDRDEDTWVNEGLSELAGQVNGYDLGSTDSLFSHAPDTPLTAWPELEDSGPHYGAAHLFLAYFLEQYGDDAIPQLVAEPADGAAGFDAVLSRLDPNGRRFDDLFADWVIANYLDDPALAQGRYGYDALDVEQPSYAARYATYPAGERATVHQYAADYILLEGQGDLQIEFEGDTVVPLVGNETHSGQVQWWSSRGDERDATLTRAFDLSGLEQATLQAWLWYDLETDFDYAYVEASADGGQTWRLLANSDTTTANPNDSSYGPALTGLSGGGEKAHWVQETFDLSRYAGGPVLVRFEVITDESVNQPGLCLDDITIPELGYHDDVEAGQDGWQAEGWLRVTDHIPQTFVVQLITSGDEVRVERMPLDASMHGTLAVHGLGREIDRAVLVVSALAPATTEMAAYSYRISRP
jgi:immune inhibitor A